MCKKDKKIFILNGMAGAGKDTFVDIFETYAEGYVKHISSVDLIKEAAKVLGWNGQKDEASRKFLSNLKNMSTVTFDTAFKYISEQVLIFKENLDIPDYDYLFIDIREPREIERAVKAFGAKTIYIENHNVKQIVSNDADKYSDRYHYDYYIDNNGTLEDFEHTVAEFATKVDRPPVKKVAAIDFDGTLCVNKCPDIGEPIERICQTVRDIHKAGWVTILWTCREGEDLDKALEWCKQHNIPIDYANENEPDRTKFFGNDSRKIGADVYIDDKAIAATSIWSWK